VEDFGESLHLTFWERQTDPYYTHRRESKSVAICFMGNFMATSAQIGRVLGLYRFPQVRVDGMRACLFWCHSQHMSSKHKALSSLPSIKKYSIKIHIVTL
jgi:hypothetical protein